MNKIALITSRRDVELLLKGESNIMIGVKSEELVTNSLTESIKLHSQPYMSKMDLIDKLKTKLIYLINLNYFFRYN